MAARRPREYLMAYCLSVGCCWNTGYSMDGNSIREQKRAHKRKFPSHNPIITGPETC